EEGVIKEAYIADYLREPPIYILTTLFIVALLAIGWRKGAKALSSLLLTMVIVWRILLPGLLRGYHPVVLTVAVAAVATIIAILIIAGFTCKSLAAILGTVGGLVVAGLAAMLVGKAAHLTGFGSEEAAMLLYIPQNVSLDIQGLLFAGIIIGALGAVMDVSMSVSSAVAEVKKANPALGMADLFRSGLNVGRDVMGSMSNTLILAYTGSSVPLLMIFMAYRESYIKMVNLDMIASEIVRAFSGSLGMVMVVPLTAFIAGLLFGRCRQPEEPGMEQDREQKQDQGQGQNRTGNRTRSNTRNKTRNIP
ncbi:MAG: YibE/F family protein, partial [Clostridia bacterium]|nr:YibE/F family protein [Clostridia bacterium]